MLKLNYTKHSQMTGEKINRYSDTVEGGFLMAIMKCQECGYEQDVADTWEICLLVPEICQKEGHIVTFQWKDDDVTRKPKGEYSTEKIKK